MVGAVLGLRVPPAAGGSPESEIPLEQAVKAAFVYNFVQLVTWPESPLTRAATLSICVLDDDSLADALETTVRDKRVMGRPLAVGRFSRIEEVAPCAVLFVGRGMAGRLPQIRQRLQGLAVLTVSDAKGFTSQGGMIGLFLEDNRVRFEVELATAQAAGLQISSKLLRLARPSSGRPCLSCAAGSGGGR
jgi:hypothetical protein